MNFHGLFGKVATVDDQSLAALETAARTSRERDEAMQVMAAAASSTTIVEVNDRDRAHSTKRMYEADGARGTKRINTGAKSKQAQTFVDVDVPKIALPNARLPGNKLKSANAGDLSTVMRVLYDDAHALVQVLGIFEKFMPFMHLVFNEDGLSLQVNHSTGTVSLELIMPRQAFVRFENLIESAICTVVSSSAVRDVVAAAAQSKHSLSFLYHQCGRADEPLHIQLNPRDGDSATAPSIHCHLPHCEDEENVVAIPEHSYQYQITMEAKPFLAAVRLLTKSASTIVLMVRTDTNKKLCFEMGSASGTNFSSMSLKFAHADEPSSAQCTITPLATGQPTSDLKFFTNHRLIAAVIELVASFGSVSSARNIIIRLGVVLDEKQGYREEPVRIEFPMRPDAEGAFSVHAWVATKIVEI